MRCWSGEFEGRKKEGVSEEQPGAHSYFSRIRLENPRQSGRTTRTALCRGSPWNRMFQAAHSGQHWETLGTISED